MSNPRTTPVTGNTFSPVRASTLKARIALAMTRKDRSTQYVCPAHQSVLSTISDKVEAAANDPQTSRFFDLLSIKSSLELRSKIGWYPSLSQVLVASDYLLEGAADEAAKARFEDHELLQKFHEVEQLSDDDKHVIKRLLDAFLTKKHLQALVRS